MALTCPLCDQLEETDSPSDLNIHLDSDHGINVYDRVGTAATCCCGLKFEFGDNHHAPWWQLIHLGSLSEEARKEHAVLLLLGR